MLTTQNTSLDIKDNNNEININELFFLKEYFLVKEKYTEALNSEIASMPEVANPSESAIRSFWIAAHQKDEAEEKLKSLKYNEINKLIKKYGVDNINDFNKKYDSYLNHAQLAKRTIVLRKLKELCFGLNKIFKDAGINHIKFHHAVSAVYQAILGLMKKNYLNKLRSIFGDVVDDEETMKLMHQFLKEYVAEFKAAGIQDGSLNRAYNNFEIIDKEGRFPLRFESIAKTSAFKGRLFISDSYNADGAININGGNDVNVHLLIDQTHADEMRDVVKEQFENKGFVLGRLTNIENTKHFCHVSLILRGKCTKELIDLVKKINEEIDAYTFSNTKTAKIATPPDIRTYESVVGLLAPETLSVLEKWQSDLGNAAGINNKLPSLHITHANDPVTACSVDDIRKISLELVKFLHPYQLDLSLALYKVSGMGVTALGAFAAKDVNITSTKNNSDLVLNTKKQP